MEFEYIFITSNLQLAAQGRWNVFHIVNLVTPALFPSLIGSVDYMVVDTVSSTEILS